MSKPRRFTKHPEFADIDKHVWEALNRIGRSISNIEKDEKKRILNNVIHKTSKNKPIWHSKSEIDTFVANELHLKLDDFNPDKSKNSLYKAIANEIGKLRRTGVIIDWQKVRPTPTGMGIWRLDKTKLEKLVSTRARQEMKNKNFHSTGATCMIFVRQKQNTFKEYLVHEYRKCAFCGFKIPQYMIGAHIVPYHIMREEDPKNSMNPINGLLLCRFCDVAFENGSITVEPDYGITISEYLQEQNQRIVKSWLEYIPPELPIKEDAQYPPARKYLKWKKELLRDNIHF